MSRLLESPLLYVRYVHLRKWVGYWKCFFVFSFWVFSVLLPLATHFYIYIDHASPWSLMILVTLNTLLFHSSMSLTYITLNIWNAYYFSLRKFIKTNYDKSSIETRIYLFPLMLLTYMGPTRSIWSSSHTWVIPRVSIVYVTFWFVCLVDMARKSYHPWFWVLEYHEQLSCQWFVLDPCSSHVKAFNATILCYFRLCCNILEIMITINKVI